MKSQFGSGCSVCGIASTDYPALCAECVDPTAVRIFCAGCRTRETYQPAAIAELCRAYDISEEIGPGTVLRLTACAACRSGETSSVNIGIFSIVA